LADDTTTADAAYQLACEGTALLWRGDFQNARQLLQAMARRADRPSKSSTRTARKKPPTSSAPAAEPLASTAFHLHRQAQAQRARVLGMVLVGLNADYSMPLRRAPDAQQACTEAWGAADSMSSPHAGSSVVTLREVLSLISAHEWRKNGVPIDALNNPANPNNNRIHPHYGVFSPVRGEYIDLVAHAPLPASASALVAFDIGTGTGVLAAVLARRGVHHITATDQDPRALACARANITQLGVSAQVDVVQANLFPDGRAALIVCNPPWLPARPSSPVEYAVYDEDSRMLLGFLNGLAAHLLPQGEGWLILSDLAEHLGLRSRAELLAAFAHAGLVVLARMDTAPAHPKAHASTDALHSARSREITSLWRLGVGKH
jgi:methylase of polypeptide subunit release factors